MAVDAVDVVNGCWLAAEAPQHALLLTAPKHLTGEKSAADLTTNLARFQALLAASAKGLGGSWISWILHGKRVSKREKTGKRLHRYSGRSLLKHSGQGATVDGRQRAQTGLLRQYLTLPPNSPPTLLYPLNSPLFISPSALTNCTLAPAPCSLAVLVRACLACVLLPIPHSPHRLSSLSRHPTHFPIFSNSHSSTPTPGDSPSVPFSFFLFRLSITYLQPRALFRLSTLAASEKEHATNPIDTPQTTATSSHCVPDRGPFVQTALTSFLCPGSSASQRKLFSPMTEFRSS